MKLISIVIPAYNEEQGIESMYNDLAGVLAKYKNYDYEIIFVDDGSRDRTVDEIVKLTRLDKRVRLIEFSRNFGKEFATSAGLHEASGHAAICIDCDLQHPPHHIPEFISKWEKGADVVVGIRKNNATDSIIKKIGSPLYYKIINRLSDVEIMPKATDYRLIDRQVIDYFKDLTEHNRMTRGLIDWLGFRRDYIYFDVPERAHGEASYGIARLVSLAIESFISYSFTPLRLAGYLGVIITLISTAFGIVILIDKFIVSTNNYNFSGPAMLAVMILFLVGIILICIGLLSYYVGHIYHNVQNRHLYIIKKPRA